jgi:hypothetical protein
MQKGFSDQMFPVSLLKASPSPLSAWSSKSDTVLDLHFCWMRNGFEDRAFPVSLLKSVTFAFKRLVIEIWDHFWQAVMKILV